MNQILANWDFGVVIVTYIIAMTIVYNTYLNSPAVGKLDERIGNPQWNFTSSWATTLTAVGALLGTVISTPSLTNINMQSGLNLFFGLLVLIAPLMYSASVKRLPAEPGVMYSAPQYQGNIRMFLVTCTLTLWGVSGELVTVGTSFYLLLQKNFISLPSLLVFALILLIAIFYTYSYAYKSIPWTIEDQLTNKEAQQYAMLMRMRMRNFSLFEESIPLKPFEEPTQDEMEEAEQYNPPLKNWSLL